MLCQSCGQRAASIHVTQLLNNEKTELHLCDVCAKQKGIPSSSALSFNDFFQGLLDLTYPDMQKYVDNAVNTGFGIQPQIFSELKCERCAMTFTEFRETGKVGCSGCYQTFHDQLAKIIKSIQANLVHTGKLPKRQGGHFEIERKIKQLQNELGESVKEERFEDAVRLRDEIKRMKEESGHV